jgi:hypothetical protein
VIERKYLQLKGELNDLRKFCPNLSNSSSTSQSRASTVPTTKAQGTTVQATMAQATTAQGPTVQGTIAQGITAQGTTAQATATSPVSNNAVSSKPSQMASLSLGAIIGIVLGCLAVTILIEFFLFGGNNTWKSNPQQAWILILSLQRNLIMFQVILYS